MGDNQFISLADVIDSGFLSYYNLRHNELLRASDSLSGSFDALAVFRKHEIDYLKKKKYGITEWTYFLFQQTEIINHLKFGTKKEHIYRLYGLFYEAIRIFDISKPPGQLLAQERHLLVILWVKYAYIKSYFSGEEARSLFKFIDFSNLGNPLSYYYVKYCMVELNLKSYDKAVKLLEQGKATGSHPNIMIQKAIDVVSMVNGQMNSTVMHEQLDQIVTEYELSIVSLDKVVESHSSSFKGNPSSFSSYDSSLKKGRSLLSTPVVIPAGASVSLNMTTTPGYHLTTPNKQSISNKLPIPPSLTSSDSNKKRKSEIMAFTTPNINLNNLAISQCHKENVNTENAAGLASGNGFNNKVGLLTRTNTASTILIDNINTINKSTPGGSGDPVSGVHKSGSKTSSATKQSAAQTPQKGATGITFQTLIQQSPDFMVNKRGYLRLEVLGRGGSSYVYKVLGMDKKIYALKCVKLQGLDDFTRQSYEEEIGLLKKLQHSNKIIKLFDSEIGKTWIFLLMEAGDIDLARKLKKHASLLSSVEKSGPVPRTNNSGNTHTVIMENENLLRLYWQQMLEAVDTIHQMRIIHGDLKPANFLFVEGSLKLIDFGIAKRIENDDHTSIFRDTENGIIGTLNYMSPEAIQEYNGKLNASSSFSMQHDNKKYVKMGPSSDIWSLGCILYAMVYGQTPFQHLQPLKKLQSIPDENYVISFPDIANKDLLNTIKSCLVRVPRDRPAIHDLLTHPFLSPTRHIDNTAHQKSIYSKYSYNTSLSNSDLIKPIKKDELMMIMKQYADTSSLSSTFSDIAIDKFFKALEFQEHSTFTSTKSNAYFPYNTPDTAQSKK